MIFDPSIFRAYDMRGIYPSQMNEKVAYAAGQAFVSVTGAKKVAVGRDVRATGVSLQNAMIQGIVDAGADAINIGVISTEMLYYAAGTLDCDGGLSVTASHNPSQWNGIKCIGKNAAPMTRDDQLGEMYEFIQSSRRLEQFEKGTVHEVNILPEYITYLEKFTPTISQPIRIVANPNFGANGKVVDGVTSSLPLTIKRLNWNEDGTFPKGTPDPSLPKNRREICELVVSEKAHFGVAWDADADRCFFYDEKGRAIHSYYVSAMLIKHFLGEEPGQAIVVERRLTWANIDAIKEGGGKHVFTKVGHSYIKRSMRENNAIFGGESSGHFYFRDFFYCDNGIIPFLVLLKLFSEHISSGGVVSDLHDYYLEHYPISQEMNYITDKAEAIMTDAAATFSDAEQDTSEGLSIEYSDWRINIRRSATEPVMRVNIEARNQTEMDAKKEELHTYFTEHGAMLRDDE